MLKRLQTRLTTTLPGGLKLWVTLLTLGFVGWALAAMPRVCVNCRFQPVVGGGW